MIAELLPDLVVSISMDARGAARPSDYTVNDFGGSHLGLCAVSVRWVMSLLGKAASRHGGHGRLPCTRAKQARDSWLKRAQSARPSINARASRVKRRAVDAQSARSDTIFLQWPALPLRVGAHVHNIRAYTSAACICTVT
jgi:hypothetical protein